jgi:hypothetical protein
VKINQRQFDLKKMEFVQGFIETEDNWSQEGSLFKLESLFQEVVMVGKKFNKLKTKIITIKIKKFN